MSEEQQASQMEPDKAMPQKRFVDVTFYKEDEITGEQVPGFPKEERVLIRQFKTKQITKILVAFAPLKDRLSFKTMAEYQNFDLKGLLTDKPVECVHLIAVMMGRDDTWVGELELDDLYLVAVTVLEVNLDFFISQFLPLLQSSMLKLASAMTASNEKQHSSTTSSASSPVATDTPTSSNTPTESSKAS